MKKKKEEVKKKNKILESNINIRYCHFPAMTAQFWMYCLLCFDSYKIMQMQYKSPDEKIPLITCKSILARQGGAP